jgi:hypothetical protein
MSDRFQFMGIRAGQIGNDPNPPSTCAFTVARRESVMGQNDQFPSHKLSAGRGCSKQTFAGTRGKEEDAPKAVKRDVRLHVDQSTELAFAGMLAVR